MAGKIMASHRRCSEAPRNRRPHQLRRRRLTGTDEKRAASSEDEAARRIETIVLYQTIRVLPDDFKVLLWSWGVIRPPDLIDATDALFFLLIRRILRLNELSHDPRFSSNDALLFQYTPDGGP
jgi:hypothetical protein